MTSSRSRAYRWGEDGLAGISDDKQQLCFAIALWNGRDPILKERLVRSDQHEGNHGEDVKEYYFYLDNTPTWCRTWRQPSNRMDWNHRVHTGYVCTSETC